MRYPVCMKNISAVPLAEFLNYLCISWLQCLLRLLELFFLFVFCRLNSLQSFTVVQAMISSVNKSTCSVLHFASSCERSIFLFMKGIKMVYICKTGKLIVQLGENIMLRVEFWLKVELPNCATKGCER